MALPLAAYLVGGAAISGMAQMFSSKKAAGAQSDATAASIQAQRESDERFYRNQERVRQILRPYVEAGYQAIGYQGPYPEIETGGDGTEVVRDETGRPMSRHIDPARQVGAVQPNSFTGEQMATGSFAQGPQQALPSQYTPSKYTKGPARIENPFQQGRIKPEITVDQQGNILSGETAYPMPQDAQRVKPSFGPPVVERYLSQQGQGRGQTVKADYGDNLRGPVSIQDFTEGYRQSSPLLAEYMDAGRGAIPTLQRYGEVGSGALEQQAALSGALGSDAQLEAYQAIEADPTTQYMMDQAKQGILSGGAATGQLRGGRTRGALREYRPELMQKLISQKYNMLSPLTSMGGNVAQNIYGVGGNVAQGLRSGAQTATSDVARMGLAAATGQPVGQPGASTTANLLQQQGAINAGQSLASGNILANALNTGVSNYMTGRSMGLWGKNGGEGGEGGGGGGGAPLMSIAPDYQWEMPQMYPQSRVAGEGF